MRPYKAFTGQKALRGPYEVLKGLMMPLEYLLKAMEKSLARALEYRLSPARMSAC